MPLDKFAAWGIAPPAVLLPPGVGAVIDARLLALDKTLDSRLPAPATRVPPTPSETALRIIWCLGAVRDALTDQNEPGPESTNAQILDRLKSHAVMEVVGWLEQRHPELLDGFACQFHTLGEKDHERYPVWRRERLAALTGFEWQVMATVHDDSPPAPPKARAKRNER